MRELEETREFEGIVNILKNDVVEGRTLRRINNNAKIIKNPIKTSRIMLKEEGNPAKYDTIGSGEDLTSSAYSVYPGVVNSTYLL